MRRATTLPARIAARDALLLVAEPRLLLTPPRACLRVTGWLGRPAASPWLCPPRLPVPPPPLPPLQPVHSAAKLARQYQQVRLHTHLAENHQDITYSEKTYGCRPGRYLQ